VFDHPLGHAMPMVHVLDRLKRGRLALRTLEPGAVNYDCNTSFPLRQVSESRNLPAVPSERAATLDATSGRLATRRHIDHEGEPPSVRLSYALNP
jgi:hypothetical protein